MTRVRSLLLTAAFSLVPTLTPRAYCQAGPVLLAEVRGPGELTWGCCVQSLDDLDAKLGFNLLYGFRFISGGAKFLGMDADAELGGGAAWFAPGESGFVDFDASNAADFNAIVTRLTNGVDEQIDTGILGITQSGSARVLTVGSGSESVSLDGINTRSDLAGHSIGFIRLVVSKVEMTHTEPDSYGHIRWSTWWDATWQFWSGTPWNTGGGQRSDVDDFLIYANPLQEHTILPASAAGYNVTIFYGTAISAASFAATLNGVSFGGFHPVAGTRETVFVPLTQGRNTLVLKVDGLRSDGREATDRDRLTFQVP